MKTHKFLFYFFTSRASNLMYMLSSFVSQSQRHKK